MHFQEEAGAPPLPMPGGAHASNIWRYKWPIESWQFRWRPWVTFTFTHPLQTFQMRFVVYSSAALDKMSPDSASRGPSAVFSGTCPHSRRTRAREHKTSVVCTDPNQGLRVEMGDDASCSRTVVPPNGEWHFNSSNCFSARITVCFWDIALFLSS